MPPGGIVDAVGQLRQLNELTAVERQLLDLAVVDDLRDLGVGRPQQRRVARHGDRVGELADLQRDRQLDLLADPQRQPRLRELPEPGQFGRDGVLADRQGRQEKPAGAIGRAARPSSRSRGASPITLTPGRTPPCASLTTPLISAVLYWASAVPANPSSSVVTNPPRNPIRCASNDRGAIRWQAYRAVPAATCNAVVN